MRRPHLFLTLAKLGAMSQAQPVVFKLPADRICSALVSPEPPALLVVLAGLRRPARHLPSRLAKQNEPGPGLHAAHPECLDRRDHKRRESSDRSLGLGRRPAI